MSEQKQENRTSKKINVVALHPIIGEYIKRTQKALTENGNDASYSVAINAMLLMAIMESKRPEGLSKETLEAVRDFVEDKSTIAELVSAESGLDFQVKPETEVFYIS